MSAWRSPRNASGTTARSTVHATGRSPRDSRSERGSLPIESAGATDGDDRPERQSLDHQPRGPGSDRVRIVSANAILDLVPRGPPCGVVPDAAGMSRYQRICDVDVSAFVFERDVHRGDK